MQSDADGREIRAERVALNSFFQNVRLNTYFARTRTPGLAGDDTSYRAQFDYSGDRYGLQVERLAVGRHFNL